MDPINNFPFRKITSVVSLGDSFEFVLSGSVPNLHFYFLVLDLNCLNLKIDTLISLVTDGHQVRGDKLVITAS